MIPKGPIAAVSAIILVELGVIVAFTTSERPPDTILSPTIAEPIVTTSSTSATVRLSAQGSDSTVAAFDIDWGDGDRERVVVGCAKPPAPKQLGGETVRKVARHPHQTNGVVRVRAISRSCILPAEEAVSTWRDASVAAS